MHPDTGKKKDREINERIPELWSPPMRSVAE